MKWGRWVRLGVAAAVMITSALACASGLTQLGFETNLTAAADTQRVNSMSVTRVRPGSTAGKAGLKAGDEILQLNGRKVHGALIQDLWREKESIRPEDTVRLQIRHVGGTTETISFPASRPLVA